MKRLSLLKKSNILYVLIIMLTITLTILLLVKEEEEVIVITREYPYSIYHSDNYETIDIEVLTNAPYSYHFDNDYIVSSSLKNEKEQIHTSIKDIKKSTHAVSYLNQDFYVVTIRLQLPFTSTEYLLELEDADLVLLYENQEEVSVLIGDIAYLFNDNQSTGITLSNLSATHEEINGYNTIGGVNIELSNTSDHNIVLKDISLLTNDVTVNNDAVLTNKTCEYTTTVSQCLGRESYDFHEDILQSQLSILVGKNNTLELYLPLLYNNTSFIYEFAIVIEYSINNKVEQLIVDNFPYMKTSIFTTFNEDDFNVYYLSD